MIARILILLVPAGSALAAAQEPLKALDRMISGRFLALVL
jgi:hypothetical protein